MDHDTLPSREVFTSFPEPGHCGHLIVLFCITELGFGGPGWVRCNGVGLLKTTSGVFSLNE